MLLLLLVWMWKKNKMGLAAVFLLVGWLETLLLVEFLSPPYFCVLSPFQVCLLSLVQIILLSGFPWRTVNQPVKPSLLYIYMDDAERKYSSNGGLSVDILYFSFQRRKKKKKEHTRFSCVTDFHSILFRKSVDNGGESK